MFKRLLQITAAILAGLVLAFIVFESGLRIMGAAKGNNTTLNFQASEAKQADYTILCLGDSNTFGLGAEKTMSYPRQLERLLNAQKPQQKFNIINAGRPGNNTSLVIESARTALKTLSPDLVIILAGANNYWNFSGYRTYRRRKKFFGKIFNCFYGLKTVKFFALSAMRFQNWKEEIRRAKAAKKPLPPGLPETLPMLNLPTAPKQENPDWDKSAHAYEDGRNFKQAQQHYKEQIAFLHGDPTAAVHICFRLACLLYQNGRHNEALSALKEGIKLCPDFADNYHKIGLILFEQEKYDHALEWFIRALEINPESESFYHHLGLVLEKTGSFEQTENQLKRLNAFNPKARDTLALIQKRSKMTSAIEDWIESDLTELVKMFKAENVKIILQGCIRYSSINKVIKAVADKEKIPFVDNAERFENLFSSGTPESEILAEDMAHANAKGYALIVENIFTAIKQNRFLGFSSEENPKDSK